MIELLDTTLRDGLQGYNINFSLQDRLAIIELLSKLNLTIEIANPSASSIDRELIACISNHAQGSGNQDNSNINATSDTSMGQALTYTDNLVVFGSTRRKDIAAKDDANLRYLAEQPIERVCIFGKASALHVTDILGTTTANNIDIITDSISYLRTNNKRVIFDAEHFFDGYKSDPDYALSVLDSAANSGADTIVLCDTNGGSLPNEIYDATLAAAQIIGLRAVLGIHCHNDGGLALASSLAAMRAGATHFQGTLLGFGERCGNTSLAELLPTLEFKCHITTPASNTLSQLTSLCRKLAEITNIALLASSPYVGASAFFHKAGMHIDAIIKKSSSFEHISPTLVGNHNNLLISQLSGKNALAAKLGEFLPDKHYTTTQLEKILSALKQKESEGYSYESAEASFILFVDKQSGEHSNYFDLISYKVITDSASNCSNSAANSTVSSSAIIKISVGSNNSLSCGEGVGPVHALDSALRQALIKFYPAIDNISLTDYKVRVLDSNGATSARVRVLITTTSSSGESWATVGVSGDIIEASFIALTDSINYWLSRSN